MDVTLLNFILMLVLKSKAVSVPGVSVNGMGSVQLILPVGEVPDVSGIFSLLLIQGFSMVIIELGDEVVVIGFHTVEGVVAILQFLGMLGDHLCFLSTPSGSIVNVLIFLLLNSDGVLLSELCNPIGVVISESDKLIFTIFDVSSMLGVDFVPLSLPLFFFVGMLSVSFSHGRSVVYLFLLQAFAVFSVGSLQEIVSTL